MALDILAKEYAAEDSVTTQTATIGSTPHDELESDDSEENEDTVVVNESYIDKLIKANQRSAEPFTSPKQSTTGRVSASHHQILYPHAQKSIGVSPSTKRYASLAHQPSQDFLLMVEHLQNQLHQKDEALKKNTKQLRQQRNDYDRILRTNNELKSQIQKLKETDVGSNDANKSKKSHVIQISTELIEKHEEITMLNHKIAERDHTIQTLTEEMEKYRQVEEWLAMQMKWENIPTNQPAASGEIKLTVKTLEEWKYFIMGNNAAANINRDNLSDDEKEPVKDANANADTVRVAQDSEEDREDKKEDNKAEEEEAEDSKAPLLKQKSENEKKKVDAAIEKELSTNRRVCYRCVPWL